MAGAGSTLSVTNAKSSSNRSTSSALASGIDTFTSAVGTPSVKTEDTSTTSITAR